MIESTNTIAETIDARRSSDHDGRHDAGRQHVGERSWSGESAASSSCCEVMAVTVVISTVGPPAKTWSAAPAVRCDELQPHP